MKTAKSGPEKMGAELFYHNLLKKKEQGETDINKFTDIFAPIKKLNDRPTPGHIRHMPRKNSAFLTETHTNAFAW